MTEVCLFRNLCLGVCLVFISLKAYAKVGVGFILIDPTGLSFCADKDKGHRFDGALAWGSNDFIFFHADYLWVKRNLVKVDNEFLNPYFGLGARIMSHDYERWNRHDKKRTTVLGVRVPGGVFYQFREIPIELFAEAAFILNLAPDTSADIDVGLGARWLF